MNELRQTEDQAKKAMADAARLAEELRQEQEHAGQIDKLRRALEVQVKELEVRVDEAEAAALHGGRKTIQSLEQRVSHALVFNISSPFAALLIALHIHLISNEVSSLLTHTVK